MTEQNNEAVQETLDMAIAARQAEGAQPQEEALEEEADDAEEATVEEEKSLIRRAALATRQELSPAARSSHSRDICNQLVDWLRGLELKGRGGEAPTVAVYASMRTEVDLDRFIRGVYAFCYRIVFPCMVPQGGTMCMRSVSCPYYLSGSAPFVIDPLKPWGPTVSEEQRLPTGTHRRFIPSRTKSTVPPKDDLRFPVVPPEEIDAIVVPMVAFDDAGGRLGSGNGVYDRYLPHLRRDCAVAGVAFAEQRVEAVPQGKHDIVIPKVISA